MISSKVKDFIEVNVDLIDDNNIDLLFEIADKELSHVDLAILREMFLEIDVDATSICWKVFDQNVQQYIKDELNNPYKDKSNSWARLDYMLDGISTVGFGWSEAKYYVLAHQQSLGLQCRKLSPEYGWEGQGDYAFQWFNEELFEQEYLFDEEF